MPTPKGGHEGQVMMAPVAGQALVVITGVMDAEYNPGQNFAEAHGMDAPHGFDVPVKSKPQVTLNRVDDKAQTTIWKARQETEAGRGVPYVFYPIGESADSDATDHGISGTCFVQVNSTQSLTDAIKNAVTLTPTPDADWTPFGNWNPA